jgi:hypothetical protein
MDSEDLFEAVMYGLFLAAIAITYLMKLKYRGRVIDVGRLMNAGSAAGIDVVVVDGPRNRRFVALEYTIPGDDESPDRDIQLVFTSAEAAKLAHHLRVASQRKGSLTFARVAARRAAKADAAISGSPEWDSPTR